MRHLRRWFAVVILLLTPSVAAMAETVSSLPRPTSYVSDLAHVLTPATEQSVENLCLQVDRQAHAQIAVATVRTLDNDQPIEEFATELEEKWKVGAKGTDRGVLLLVVMNPRKGRIEVGYGLEGILNDAKAGDILRAMVPYTRQGDFDTAISGAVQSIAQIITTDAGVTLTTPGQQMHQYHRQEQPVHISFTQLLIGGGAILLILFFLVKTGNTGLIFFLLGNLMGGGGGGYRGGDDDRGGGFGGFGGGSSGGGGASGDL